MNCPCCNTRLETIEYEGVSINTCPGCKGEFIDPTELSHIVRAREERFAPDVLSSVADRTPVFGVPSDDRTRTLECPACQSHMQVLNYATDTGISIDRCEGCGGVWLDDQELENVQALLELWADRAAEQIMQIAPQLEEARQSAETRASGTFDGSRFAFVNALINRILDTAA